MLRSNLAIIIGRLVIRLCHWLKRSGTSLPGYLALKIDPALLNRLTAAYQRVIIVTGTNGKTTTTNLLATILRAAGWKVTHNTEGANMPAGVVTALLGPPQQVAVLEVDEGTLGLVTSHAKADLVVVTNLLRDQLDRYHELEQLAAVIKNALAMLPGATLLLNADDSLVTFLGANKEKVRFFGMARTPWSKKTTDEVLEGHICPLCQQPLQFNYYHYSHLGDYFCQNCSYRRPAPDYEARRLNLKPGETRLSLLHQQGEVHLHTPMIGIYNVYNILAAASAALQLQVQPDVIAQVVVNFLPGQGRAETFNFQGKRLTLLLVKNPAGLSVTLRTITAIHKEAAYLLAINDLAADGRDVSWLWDADLKPLLAISYSLIICAGLRAGDMAICLKYQGVNLSSLEVIPDPEQSLERLLAATTNEAVILCTYTNLAVYRKLLMRRGAVSEAAPVPSIPGTA